MLNKIYKSLLIGCLVCSLVGCSKTTVHVKEDCVKATEHIYCAESVSQEEVDLVQSYINNLPECIQKHFVDDGAWNVYIVESMPDGVKGSVVVEENAVYIVSGYELDHLNHEFAHIYLHNHPLDDKFQAIYEEEAQQMIKAYYGDEMYSASNATEFFCSAWNIVYTMGGYDSEGVAPKTFAYFVDLFSSLYQ